MEALTEPELVDRRRPHVFEVYVILRNGTRDVARRYGTLDEAVTAALRLADEAGYITVGDQPSAVVVRDGSSQLLSIQVISGGLLARPNEA